MNTPKEVAVARVLVMALILFTVGCYYRTTAPSYDFNPSEVTRIRQQLGVKTSDQEFLNLEEPQEDQP